MNAMKILSNARPGFLNAFADALVFVAAVPTPGDIECGVVSVGNIRFGCALSGSDANGFDVWAQTSDETNKTVSKRDGSKQSWTYRDGIVHAIARGRAKYRRRGGRAR
jgi:hypothetical protein